MKSKQQFRSIKNRLMTWFLVVALIPLAISFTIIYIQRVEAIKTGAFDKLRAIRDLKVGEINYWLDEKTGDVQSFSRITEVVNIDEFLRGKTVAQDDAKSVRTLSDILNGFRESYNDYEELSLISTQSGKIIVSTNKSLEGTDVSGSKYLIEPLRTGGIYISDIYWSRSLNKPTMDVSVPIRQNGRHKDKLPCGVLVVRIDLEHSVYALLLNRTGLGKTGETLIVNKDGVALNELRWHNRAPLKLKIEAKPALLASRGNTGIAETRDYRGEKVLAAYTHVPRTKWGFVAKIDIKEAYAPINKLLAGFLILFSVTAAGVYLISLFLASNTARPILDITAVAKRIREGDLYARNSNTSVDEIGFLAESFNQAADSVASQIKLQEINKDISETLIAANELNDFRKNLLKKLVEVTDSQLGAYFLFNRGNNTFEPFTSIGVTPELLHPFDVSALDGELGMVIETKRMVHIKDIPDDTIFRFRTFTGTILPKEIISIPIVIDNVVRGVVSMASVKPYSLRAIAILNLPWAMMVNTVLDNLRANEKTRRLSEELQEINQELQAQQEELLAQAEELRKQSEELQEQNVELEQQQRAVEEASRLKSQFLSNMSHELRTPLNSVMALSRVLMMQAKEKLSDEEVNYLAIIERNGKNLLALINDILDLSKIEAGRMDVNPKPFSFPLTVENIIESIDPIAGEKHIEIHQNIPEDLPLIESDEIRVSQILQNLIGNAVKFTNAGTVTVSVQSDKEKLFVIIEDTGIGIAEKDLPNIFDEFRQVDGTSSRRHEGTGLGLAIARKAARMLGGDIAVTSALDKGSTFTLTLPVAWQGTAPVYEPIVARQHSGVKPARKTILVVDDEPEMAAMISRYLLQEGYNTLTATSGAEALKLAARELPFAITLDIIMPDIDGWEVLQGLKKNPGTKDIPVIIVSISEDRETGFALGAVGYVSKPVSRKQLISEIQKIGKQKTHLIMIADDNDLDRQEISQIIEEEGLKPIVAEDGAVCLELIKKQVPDVLVLDLMMPEPDGFAVLERIRGNPDTRDLPVIVVTAKDLTEDDRNRLRGNVFSVLEKSAAKSATLLEEIKRILIDLASLPQQPGIEKSAALPRILIVEDNEAAIIQVKAVLDAAGYIADVARGGQEAINYVSHTIPDGIILDLMMPDIDGFAVLEKIRGTKATIKIPVLILTAKDLTPEDFKRLSANHVQQLVQKGDVDKGSLLSMVKSMLGGEERKVDTGNLMLDTGKSQTRRKQDNLKPEKQPATILVVEDNPDNMTTVRAVLQNRYLIVEATDGEEGLRIAAEVRPDMILLDMALPKIDGYTIVRRLKDNSELCNITVIAMTARVMKGDREKIIETGCDDYIAKPFDPENLLKKIEEWLEKRG